MEHPYTVMGRARREGRLQMQPCEACGEPKAEAHHDDYAEPLQVRWLCRSCHRGWHAQHGPGLNRHLVRAPTPQLRGLDALMTPPELMFYLTKECGLPYLKAGSLFRFRKAEVDAWLERERVA